MQAHLHPELGRARTLPQELGADSKKKMSSNEKNKANQCVASRITPSLWHNSLFSSSTQEKKFAYRDA